MNYIDAQSARKRYLEVKHRDLLHSETGKEVNKEIYLALEDGKKDLVFDVVDLSESTVGDLRKYLEDAGFEVTRTYAFGDKVLKISWV